MLGKATSRTQLAWLVSSLGMLFFFQTAAAEIPSMSAEPAASPVDGIVPQSLLLKFLADNSTFTLIDARSPDEFSASHITGAINIPHDASDDAIPQLPSDPHEAIVVYCKTGRRAAQLRMKLEERGYTNVRVLLPDQIVWFEGLAVFNCGTPSSQTSADVLSSKLVEGSTEETK